MAGLYGSYLPAIWEELDEGRVDALVALHEPASTTVRLRRMWRLEWGDVPSAWYCPRNEDFLYALLRGHDRSGLLHPRVRRLERRQFPSIGLEIKECEAGPTPGPVEPLPGGGTAWRLERRYLPAKRAVRRLRRRARAALNSV